MYSEPTLSEPDIVSLLTLGATGSQLTKYSGNEGAGETLEVLMERMGALSSRRINGYISAGVGNMLNLDSIYIEGNLLKTGTGSGPVLRATKKVTDNTAITYINSLDGSAGALSTTRSTEKTDITYETGIGYSTEDKVRIGYSLNDNIRLQSHTDRSGNSGISLKYSIWKK